nr:MAG TPA: hypothetical protein [Caudoviricetes sp.]
MESIKDSCGFCLESRLCLRNNCHFLCFQLHSKAEFCALAVLPV